MKTVEWPKWSLPDEEEQLRLVAMAVPYIRFLHPEIVRAVVEDNERHRERWAELMLQRNVDPSPYLWHKSSCMFPGVRRYAGSSEIAQFRRRMTAERVPDALALDDNSYPKAIWSFVFRGKPFQNQGPPGYALAHLADHKTYKNRGHVEFDTQTIAEISKPIFGLYTSISNTVYMPDNLIRLTDFSFMLRNLVQRKAVSLYGGFCNLLPPPLSFRANDATAWSLNNFQWSEPVGTSEHLAVFLAYRQGRIENLLSINDPRE
jgi:hypothetical protein